MVVIGRFPILCVIACSTLQAACGRSTNEASPEAPSLNVVVIISDDQSWRDYGFMGHPDIETPNLDRLAGESLRFDRGYVCVPLCRPSVASIVSGLHPHQHGIVANDVTLSDETVRNELNEQVRALFNAQPNLINQLVSKGYLALQTGKWWEGSWQASGFSSGTADGSRDGGAGLTIGRSSMQPVADYILQAVEKDRPFLIWYAPLLPHIPHNPKEELLDKYMKVVNQEEVARYYGMCEYFDMTCGQLIDFLEIMGLRQNTLIVYISDNGWVARSQSDIEIPQTFEGLYAPRSKASPYDNGIRTPILISLPGTIEPERSTDLASSIDLYPTIMTACGLDVPQDLPGINLLDKEARRDRDAVFGAAYSMANMTIGNPADTRQYRWVITRKWKYIVRDQGRDTTRYRFIHAWDQTPTQLFDLVADPGETTNLVDRHPEVVQELSPKLEAWLPRAR